MFIVSPTTVEDEPVFDRLCYTCAVNLCVDAQIDIVADASLADILPSAAGLMLMGETSEQLWSTLSGPCGTCGAPDS